MVFPTNSGYPFVNKNEPSSSRCGSVVMNPTSMHEDVDSNPGPAQWIKDLALLGAMV